MRAALFSLAVLIAFPAQAFPAPWPGANWKSSQIAGTPRDVVTIDAGVAVVASINPSGTMAIFAGSSSGGISQQVSFPGNFDSATWRPPDCLVGLFTSASVQFEGSCSVPAGAYLLSGGPGTGNRGRLRSQPNGAINAYVSTNTGALKAQHTDPNGGAVTTDWILLNPFGGDRVQADAPLSVLAIPGGGQYAALGRDILFVSNLSVFVDGGIFRNFPQAGIRDVALFENNGVPAGLVLNDGGQVLLNPDLANAPFTPINLPVRPYGTVSFTTSGGSAFGRGFGMLTVGNEIYSAVPNPNAVGREWVLRPEDAGFRAALVRATCHDPSFCAAITSSVGAPNVFAYFNDSLPQSDLRAAVVPYGGTATYVLDAGDPDGDPIWVTWEGGGVYWDGGDPRTVTVFGPAPSCTAVPPTAAPLRAVLSDGLAAHNQPIKIPVTMTGTGTRPPLLEAIPASLSLIAGGPAQSVAASVAEDGGCTLPALSWSIAPDGGLFNLVLNATGVTVEPPLVFCRSTPQDFLLTGTDGADASVNVTVTLGPWGKPFVPDFASGLEQPAGTAAGYAPINPAHACEGPADFPGTELRLIGFDGGAPGVTVVADQSQLLVSSSNACVGGTVVAKAIRRVINFPQQFSNPAGTLQVTLVPNWSPITTTTSSFDAGFSYDPAASQLVGDFSIDANCQSYRDLRAQVLITTSTGAPVNSQSGIEVPGGWRVDVPGGCSGGSFRASASMIDDAGTPYGPTASYAFETGRIAARVPALKQTEVPVTCAEGARGELELDLLKTDCSVQQLSWIQEKGPALAPRAEGPILSFSTGAGKLEELAGQELGWSITATVGPGNTQTASRSIRLVPAAFVKIAHRTDVPIAREEEAVGVEVILTNDTACAVSGVVLRESLGGLQPIPGSVRVAGARRDSTLVDGVLEVPQLALPARGSTRVTYLAKVPLLSAARPSGRVLLTGTDVTIAAPTPPATGCGCGSTAEGALALLVLAGAAVRSRRRSG